METAGKIVVIGLLLSGMGAFAFAGYLPIAIKSEREVQRAAAEQARFDEEQERIERNRELQAARADSAGFVLWIAAPNGDYSPKCEVTANQRVDSERFAFVVDAACIPRKPDGTADQFWVMPNGDGMPRNVYDAALERTYTEGDKELARVTANLADISAKVFPQPRAGQSASMH